MESATTPEITKETIQLAKKAIKTVLVRIRENPDVRWHMGGGTETFEQLKRAYSALFGISEKEIEAQVFVQLSRKSASEKLSAIRDIADASTSRDMVTIQNLCRE